MGPRASALARRLDVMRLPAKESDEAGDATSAGSSVHCWLLAANDRIDRRGVDVLC